MTVFIYNVFFSSAIIDLFILSFISVKSIFVLLASG